jgi:Protein of unknown function (DUF3667)
VSHAPQRKEKDCLNCGATVVGRFCHICGQENVEPKETFWHMVTHFFYDITHFDSKFFETVKDIVLRPGFLSKEYMLGRRARYLHPVRMYVFTSAIFFLLFFSFFKPHTSITTNINKPVSAKKRADFINTLQTLLEKDTGNMLLKEKLLMAKDTNRVLTLKDMLGFENDSDKTGMTKYKSLAEYDSVEKNLPASEKDGWVMRRWMAKKIEINNKIQSNPDEALKEFLESLLHRLPYMLFVSLPLFALILKLVYVRRRQFYYADHGVFTIHIYVFTFLVLMAVFGLSSLKAVTGWGAINFLTVILFIALFFYLNKAMRNFYGQRRGKTFVKFIIVALFSLLMMLILFILFMFFSAITL